MVADELAMNTLSHSIALVFCGYVYYRNQVKYNNDIPYDVYLNLRSSALGDGL